MSGIVGLYCLDGRPVAQADLEEMVESLAHRGPDGVGVWQDGPIGLGHRMLWTTHESLHERLPAINQAGDLVLTADARLDNRDELIAALSLAGRPHEQIPDSALILGAYEQWGDRCPEKLLGDFAFALWDRRTQVLVCARDHMGVKPFYYYRSPRVFVFASELKALLRLPQVPRRLNEVRVADYLMPMLEDKASTFYQQILRLPPAHCMVVDRQQTRLWAYWSLDSTREIRYRSDAEYAQALRALFTQAVRCRVRSPLPIGSLLSGGLDSSSIVCVARRLLAEDGRHRLHTFSAVFDEVPECDERPFINAVLAQGGVEPQFVRADLLSPLADLDRVLWHEDEPFYAPNLFMHWALYGAARAQGIRILFDGLDGDTTLWQRPSHLADLVRAGQWRALTREVRGLATLWQRSPWRIIWHFGLTPLAPDQLRKAWRWLRRRHRPPWTRHAIINAAFARRIGLAARGQALLGQHSIPARTSREDHWRRLTSGLVPFVLEVADRAAAAFALEPRYPFFDRRVVEFCLALPPEQKLSQGWTRVVMRRAMTHLLPETVQWRSGKSNLSPNFCRGLLRYARAPLEEVILNDATIIQPYIDVAAVQQLYRRYVSQGDEEDAMAVWRVVTLGLWLRRTKLAP